mmetsp:Transcript_138425/g.430432  ORF Transcript_138425/g.430432 Transcript_138425/m.430432 type:complete len:141 (+) Transcript_138425:80-502(+)
MAGSIALLVFLAGTAAPAAAYVPAATISPHVRRGAAATEQALPRTVSSSAQAASDVDTEEVAGPLPLAALSCAVGAVFGWAGARRRHAAATAAMAAGGLSPMAARAANMDPLSNPDLGYVFLVALTSMSIALVVWGRNGL